MTRPPAGPDARAAVLVGLPEAVRRRLDLYAALLTRWQGTINLVAPSTLPDLWTRHIADSLQVQAAAPEARAWVDLGSGGGFPGLVTAAVLADEAEARVHLVESDKRKSAFLRTVIREAALPATVHAERIEVFVPAHAAPVDAVSARALASLPQLLEFARPFLERGATGVFPQGIRTGEDAPAELTLPGTDRRFRCESLPSRVRSGSRLLIVRAAQAGEHGPGGD